MNAAAPEGAPAADLNNGLLKSQNQEIVINFREPLTAGPGATRRGVAPTPRSGVGNILIRVYQYIILQKIIHEFLKKMVSVRD
jgi:hypothetical protein